MRRRGGGTKRVGARHCGLKEVRGLPRSPHVFFGVSPATTWPLPERIAGRRHSVDLGDLDRCRRPRGPRRGECRGASARA